MWGGRAYLLLYEQVPAAVRVAVHRLRVSSRVRGLRTLRGTYVASELRVFVDWLGFAWHYCCSSAVVASWLCVFLH